MLDACLGAAGRVEFESLLEAARLTRQQMLTAVSAS
jgi:hypothetical protein